MARWKNINGVLQKIAGSVRIDQVLNKLSRNAISNKAVSEKFEEVDLSLEIAANDIDAIRDDVDEINTHLSRKMNYLDYSSQEQVASQSVNITTTPIDLWTADRDCFVKFFTNVTGGVATDGIHIKINNSNLDLYNHYIKGYMSSGLYPIKRGDVLKVSKDPNVQPAVVVYAFDLID